MGIFSGMTDKDAPRGFSWIWYLRIPQLLGTLGVLGLAGLHAYQWKDCSVPSKIAWNLACAAISLLVLIYFFFSTGPAKVFKLLPWLVWGQLALDALMLVFWLAAAATSKLNCKDYCKACSDTRGVSWNNRDCLCFGSISYSDYDYYSYKRDLSPAPRGLSGGLEPRKSRGGSGDGGNVGSVDARTALDAIMTGLFAITLASTIWWVFSQRRSTGTAAPTIPPPIHAEAGNAGFPLNSGQQPVPAYGPEMTQPVFDPSHPQGQYPVQPPPVTYQAGAPGQY